MTPQLWQAEDRTRSSQGPRAACQHLLVSIKLGCLRMQHMDLNSLLCIYIYISSLSKSLRNSCWIMMLTRLPPCHHPHLQLALRESTLRSTPTDKDFSLLPTRRRCHQNQEQKQKVKPKKRRQPNRRPRQKQRLNPSPAHRYPKTSLPTALREESSCPSFLVAYEFPCSV